jgi:hypothetical protein
VKDQSHKDEMSAAIRGDFQRLRDRGVAATLAPRDDETEPSPADVIAEHEKPAVPEVVAALAEPVTEPQSDERDELPAAGRHGFLARLLGR